MAIAQNYPNIVPSLSLDFASVKALDPRITFNRASTATYYGTETAKAEENLLRFSQEFDNAAFTKSNTTVTADTTAAPDGTTTADKLAENTATTAHIIFSTGGFPVSAGTFTASVFAKADERTRLLAAIWNGSNYELAQFDLANGTILQQAVSGMASITSVGNDWYRCTVTRTIGATTTFFSFGPYINENISTLTGLFPNYTGTAGNGIFIWGAQLEQRSAVTAYTPTTTQPITNFIPVLESAASGVARFDHNPVTKESLGLLIEEQRTNLQTRSQFDAGWTSEGLDLTSNIVIAPNGTLTGAELTKATTSGPGRGFLPIVSGLTSGQTVTASAFVKANGYSFFALRDGFSGRNVIFNLATGLVSSSSNATGVITPIGNGWYRCSATMNTTASSFRLDMQVLETALQTVTTAWVGDGFSGIFIWGAQLEVGAFPTSYIPTVASQVTRAADAASITGANFSSWYNAAEGTLFGEVKPFGVIAGANAVTLFSVSDGTTNNFITNRINSAGGGASSVRTNGINQTSVLQSTVVENNVLFAQAFSYKANDFRVSVNGGSIGTATSGVLPVINQALLGATGSTGVNTINGTISKLSYYPVRVTNEQLQGLTS